MFSEENSGRNPKINFDKMSNPTEYLESKPEDKPEQNPERRPEAKKIR